MKKLASILVLGLVPVLSGQAANIVIIESQSYNIGHTMDEKWQSIGTNMGHAATILPQSTLDSVSNLSAADMLVVSSGIIGLSSQRVNTIEQYLMLGQSVYIQGEYQSSYATNQAFATIVNNLGGSFSWSSIVSGTLITGISGALATAPNAVNSVNHFWWGITGTGDSTVEVFAESGGQGLGWIFRSPNPDHGALILTTDQDWIREDFSPQLVENIIAFGVNAVPEPSSLLLLALGAFGLLRRRRG